MKKKLLSIILSICAVFSLALFCLNPAPKTNASAYVSADITYTVTDNGDTLTLTDSSGNSSPLVFETLASAIHAIETYETAADTVVKIVFDNVSLSTEEQITLYKSLVISGSLETVNSSNLFLIQNTSENKLSFVLENLTLTNTNNTLSDFSFFSVQGSSGNSITLNNINFNLSTTSIETSHAIYFKSSENTLTLKGEITHDTSLFYNYVNGNSMHIHEDSDNPIDNFYTDDEGNALESSELLYISVPYTAKDTKISTGTSSTNHKRFKIVANNDFFTVKDYLSNSSIIVSSTLTFNFDLNGGAFNDGYTPPQTFYFSSGTTNYNFPTYENVARSHYTFDGWFGKITYNGITYYFDQTSLKNYTDNNGTLEDTNLNEVPDDVETYFKTSLNDFSIDTSFNKYCYASLDTSNNIAEFESIKFFADNNLSPTFIAKWNIERYSVSFDAKGGTETAGATYDYDAPVEEPTKPTKTGYTFDGWYTNETYETKIDFSTYKMPASNITLVAKWNINSYTITFITNNGETIAPKTYNYGETIEAFETLTQTGNIFNGWYEYNDQDGSISETKFNLTTMPARNITVYAKWQTQRLLVYFNTLGGTFNGTGETTSASSYVDYNGYIIIPATPTKTGHTFHGWFKDQDCTNGNQVQWIDGTKYQIKTRTTFYAKWIPNEYHLEIYTNIDGEVISKNVYYGKAIELPENLTFANYKFAGWFKDETFETKFNIIQTPNMPANNLKIYAKWVEKPLPTIDETAQVYGSDKVNSSFEINSFFDDFIIRYYVDNEWTLDAPTEVGSYDIMITRNEDDTYARYEKVLKNAFVIEAVAKDFTWLIVILFLLAAFEIIVCIAIRFLRKMKRNMTIGLAIPLGSSFIPGNQVVLLFISGALALFGFILLVYQLVKLHRTIPSALTDLKEEDHSKEDRLNQSNKVVEETNTYSADDIEAMLINDKVGQAIKEKHKLDEKDFSENQTSRAPIGPINYTEYDDEEDNNEDENNPFKENVEIVEDEYVFDGEDEQTKLYNSEDPFLRKNPDDYSNSDDFNEK